MRMPQSPPPWTAVLQSAGTETFRLITGGLDEETLRADRYLHWDKLRYLKPPESLTHQQWWAALKLRRMGLSRQGPLSDIKGHPFTYCPADPIPEFLHKIDRGAGGVPRLPEQITTPDVRDRYVVSSLMEEAIRSSQIEGAVATRTIAKDMLRSGRKPRDRSERMILNNYRAMRRIRELRHAELTTKVLLDLHRILTAETLEDDKIGRFRVGDEPVFVMDSYNEVFHTPPPAETLEARVNQMCDFANGKTPDRFVHPVLRAIILHFWLAYDHPFWDGNGRCARALFYWSMLRSGYWLTEYISISEIMHRAPVQYYRAFLYTETDENDLTYFILYHLQTVDRAIQELHAYIHRKTEEVQQVEQQLRETEALNHRQRALLSHALRHPGARYTIESHQSSHGVVYETARSDLLRLHELGLLKASKVGRRWHFSPARDLGRRLSGESA